MATSTPAAPTWAATGSCATCRTARGRVRNYQGSLAEAFARMAKVGEVGCGFEQPFEATRRALSGTLSANDGFLREEALLVVVFVSDEDDCSMTRQARSLPSPTPPPALRSAPGPATAASSSVFDAATAKGARQFGERTNCQPDEDSPYLASVSSFASFLHELKDHPGKIVVAGIYGKPNGVVVEQDARHPSGTPRLRPACESSTATATPGIRLNAMLSQFPARAAQSSICEPDLSWALRRTALLTRKVANRSHCLIGVITDTDFEARGIQPSCSTFAITDRGTKKAEVRTRIPHCAEGQTERCFTLEVDQDVCADTESQLALRITQTSSVAKETLTVDCDTAKLAKRSP